MYVCAHVRLPVLQLQWAVVPQSDCIVCPAADHATCTGSCLLIEFGEFLSLGSQVSPPPPPTPVGHSVLLQGLCHLLRQQRP